MSISKTVAVLEKLSYLSSIANSAAWAIVGLEYFVCILLFSPRTRRIGLYSSLAMMTAFTAFISYMMIFVPHLPCSCGGVIAKMSWKQHLVFNIFFTILSLWALLLDKRKLKDNFVEEKSQPVFT